MKHIVWRIDGAQPSRFLLTRRLTLNPNRAGYLDSETEPNDQTVTIVPIDPVRQVICVLLIPWRVAGRVTCNGIALLPGLHELRHADRLEWDHKVFWISTEFSAEETEYDPAKHPSDAFCFLTKARLAAGDPIVICPGTANTPCGMIFKHAAWAMAQQAGTALGCPNCGFNPARDGWTPPAEKPAGELDRLLELAARGRQQEP